ncbi:MAG: YihY/virulence factor BrkB family protein [Beijerinckiaceae bacterium]
MSLYRLKQIWRVLYRVYDGLYRHDGWAIASHIALSILLALFPFLIFLTALGSFFGTQELAEPIVKLLIDALPEAVSGPLAQEVRNVLTGQRRDLLTIGGALAIWFSSSGVESLRVGLNRAYGLEEMRSWVFTRAQSIGFVLVGAVGLLAFGFLIVLAPAVIAAAAVWAPELAAFARTYDLTRYGATSAILLTGLVMAHLWLPAKQRPVESIAPGIVLTLAAWLLSGFIFGAYLARFSTYASTYAGFAAPMMALVFLYFLALIFIAGAELNAAIDEERRPTVLT